MRNEVARQLDRHSTRGRVVTAWCHPILTPVQGDRHMVDRNTFLDLNPVVPGVRLRLPPWATKG